MRTTYRRLTFFACALAFATLAVIAAPMARVYAFATGLADGLWQRMQEAHRNFAMSSVYAVVTAATVSYAAAKHFILRIIRRVYTSLHTPYLWGALPV